MGLPVEVNNLMLGSLGGYTVGRSLRFRSSASAYLNRTPASASNRTTWTWSGWVKRGLLTTTSKGLFSAVSGLETLDIVFEGNTGATADTLRFVYYTGSALNGNLVSTPVYRDPSAWYHIVAVWNTTDATSSNRMRLYVNGVEVTAFGTASYPTQNTSALVNNTVSHTIGRYSSTTNYFDGYLAEVNFIDGQALTPSSFGAYDTNGVWQPKKYSGTYGTNGFYLPFSNTTSTTTLVADSSGNGNNWTPNNISLTAGTTYDSMVDSPTVGATASNYCVLNPLDPGVTASTPITNGNLTFNNTNASGWAGTRSTFGITSGKWYWECNGSANAIVGLMKSNAATANPNGYPGVDANGWGYGSNNGSKYNNGSGSAYGATWTASTDICGIAFDADAGTLTFYKNGVSQGTAYTGLTSGPYFPAFGCAVSSSYSVNFGQRPFSYTPPTGFLALNTYNLPTPTILNGAQQFAATTYTGNGSTQSISNAVNGVSFQPDLVWIKRRNTAADNVLYDSVRTLGVSLSSNLTSAEPSATNGLLTAFNSNGFSVAVVSANNSTNGNSDSYIGWQWKAGGTGVSNTAGTISATVSANPTAGFSVVTYTGNGTTGATIGHGLGVAPKFIMVKARSAANAWNNYTTAVDGSLDYFDFSTAAKLDSAQAVPTSSVFSVSNGVNVNGSGTTYVAYCFADVTGYSKIGNYTGNGSSDGPFIYTGFRPKLVLAKATGTANGTTNNTLWTIWDTSRNTYNATVQELYPNTSGAESTDSAGIDILSNGFKLKRSSEYANWSGTTYIYAAFAETPFNYSRAR